MEILQLEYVVALSKHKSFTEAANEVNITQPSLSQQINKLEAEIGVKIFERTTRKVELTPAGVEFLNYALRILSEVNDARASMQQYINTSLGYIKIGGLPSIGFYRITSEIAKFKKSYPGIKLEFVEEECKKLQQMLLDSKIDLAFLSETVLDHRLEFTRLVNDELRLVTGKLHPLATRQSVSLLEIKNEKFIIPSPDSGLYDNFLKVCEDVGVKPNVLSGFSQIETIVDFVCQHMGVTLLSTMVIPRYKDRNISTIRLTPKIHRRISLAVLKKSKKTPALTTFVNYFKNSIKFKNTLNY